ncbi:MULTISPECIES: heavy-metal-associated domain-containing protein [unclassified Modestobacter]|uniref:heavy-metal-associated domain-containing protein n=1 Tax=unclassified Modestobacter TaxID=2643866 RepID=UPI0022AA3F32|nr:MULTISPECIES: heavy-metal-associated domain-containing protein [unclassified Modestobacter]MCZ2825872.1 heavy-metal-associated domain-containing protein [Modestobacter sp. VKM Ac-2981]MCZ2853063.1 heavy-metal-associated domain-containing protein [Modestobacter sp. VKM Ac-2982]
MSMSTYTVVGMTCAHCVNSVTQEVSQVAGVSDVSVDLPTGGLTVTTATDVDESAVRAAVEQAGYQVIEPVSSVATSSLPLLMANGRGSGCGCGCS